MKPWEKAVAEFFLFVATFGVVAYLLWKAHERIANVSPLSPGFGLSPQPTAPAETSSSATSKDLTQPQDFTIGSTDEPPGG
jgi:hypothetical protein